MNFDTYQIPNEYTNKFKVTEKDLKVFQNLELVN